VSFRLHPGTYDAVAKLQKAGKPVSDIDQLFRSKARLDSIERELNYQTGERELSIGQRKAVADAQARASEVFATLSESAPTPRPGESPND
jgi:hypothetical protein